MIATRARLDGAARSHLGAFEADGRRWHCFATAPAEPLPDTWSREPTGPEAAEGLRFEYRWVALEGGEALAGAQEQARRAVAAFVAPEEG